MDFQKITSDLLGTGLTERQLADLVPCSQPTINAFRHGKRGARPSMLIGTRLVDLHKQRCKKHRVELAAAGEVPIP